jgi:hypothetical protein
MAPWSHCIRPGFSDFRKSYEENDKDFFFLSYEENNVFGIISH